MSQNNNLRTNLAAARPQHLEPITFLSSASQSQSQSQQQQNVDLYNNNQNNNNNLRSRLETFLTNSQRLIPVSSSLSNSAHHNNRSSMSLSQNQNQQQQQQSAMLNNNSSNNNAAMMMMSDFGYFKRISLFGGSTSSSSSQLRDPSSSAFGGFGLGRGAGGGTKSISASPAFPFLNVNQIPSADIYTARAKMNDLISQNEHEATKNTRNNNATNNIYSSKGKEIPDYQMLAEVVKYEKDLARARALEQAEEEEELESLRKLRRKKQNDLEFGTRQHEKKRTKSFFLRSKLKPEERRNISAEEAFEMALQNVHRFERDRIGINMQKRLKEEFNNNQDGNANKSLTGNKNNNRQASFLLTSKAAVAEMKTANVNSHVHQTQTPLQGMNRRRREWELQQLEQDERLFNEAKESEETSKLQEKALRQIKLKEEVFDVFRQFREGRKDNNNASSGENNNNIRQRQGETSTMAVPQNSANNNNNNNKKKSVLEMAFSDDDDDDEE